MVGLFHHAFSIPTSWRANIDRDAVMFRHCSELRSQTAIRGVNRRWTCGQTATCGSADRAGPPPRPEPRPGEQNPRRRPEPRGTVRKTTKPDQQMRLPAQAPRTRWIGQFGPVPLGFLVARWMSDDGRTPALDRLTGLAVRPQPTAADRRGQARIRPGKPQLDDLIEQRRRPQMRIITEGSCAVAEVYKQVAGGLGGPGAGGGR